VAKRRRLDVENLAAAHRAAKAAGASAGRWWKSLSDAADTTTTTQSLDTLLRDAMVAMAKALQVDTVAMVLANDTGDELVARVATGLGEETSLDLGIRAGQGMSGWVLENRRPLIIADLSKITVVSPTLRDSGLRSIAAVPVLSEDHPLAVLYAGSRELDRFDASDVGMLELLADRLAAAIERVRLFETERAARTRAEELADRLARTQGVTARLAAAGGVSEVANALAGSLVEGHRDQGVRWTCVWLLRDGMLQPVGVATHDGDIPPLGPVSLDDDRAIGRAARFCKPLYFELAEADPDGFPTLARVFPDAAIAVVPILLREMCLGVLTVVYRPGHQFSTSERDFLETVADQVAQALERARLAEAQEQLGQVSAFFARAARVLAEGNDLADTLERLAGVALPALGDICLVDVTDEEGGITRMVARHRDPSRQSLVDRLRTHYPPVPLGPHPAAFVIRTGTTRWSTEMSDDFLAETTQNEDHLALTKALGFRSYISVPLHSGGDMLGCLTLVSVTRRFETDDVSFAEELADQVAAVVQKARRYDIAARTSHILQSNLLPSRLPDMRGLEIHTRYVTASDILEVGGDFYDVVPITSERVAFMIGDVAGHDRDAAALMGQLRSAARTLAGRVGSPADLITALQQSWERLDFDRIATGIFGQIDVTNGEMVMASAGHYPPLLLQHDGTRYVPVEPSPPLGVPGAEPVDWHGQLEPGDVLLLFTDGLIDERNKGTEVSMEELAATAGHLGGMIGLSELCDRVVATLPSDRVDDVALLALRRDAVS